MRISKICIILLLAKSQLSICQNNNKTTVITGKISANSTFLSEIEVVNLNSEISSKVNDAGEFNIAVTEDDVISFTSKSFEPHRITITKEDISKKFISIEMITKSIELEEVIINQYPNINARSLGIIPENQKTYTIAERRFSANSGGIVGLINMINGKRKMLKKELEVEKKLANISRLEHLFIDKFYTEKLLIPKDYIKGFQYYCIEDTPFINALKAKNKTLCEFHIIKLAKKYLQIISNEQK